MTGLVLPVATCIGWVSCRKFYVGPGPLFATSVEPLAYHQNVACLSLF